MPNPPAGMIDVHTHAIDPGLPDLNGEFPGNWPAATHREDGRLALAIGTHPYRVVDDRCWSAERRIADMDTEGVAAQVVSPMPTTLLHGNDPAGAAVLAAAQNEFLDRLRSRKPDRLQAFGAVPLQDVDAAVAELRSCVERGFLGVAIGTRVRVEGEVRPLTDPGLDPFFVEAARLNAIVFVHPVDAESDPRLLELGLGFGAGMQSETGIAAAGLLDREVMARRADGPILLAHGGGTLPWLLPRLDKGERLVDRQATGVASERVRRHFFTDSLTYDSQQLQIVADRVGAGHVLLGTDYPFIARERPAGAVLTGLPALEPGIARDNLLSLIRDLMEEEFSWATSSASA